MTAGGRHLSSIACGDLVMAADRPGAAEVRRRRSRSIKSIGDLAHAMFDLLLETLRKRHIRK
jgi:hypothetical protein